MGLHEYRDCMTDEFETSQCNVKIFNLGKHKLFFNGKAIFAIVSTHNANEKVVTRFGTKEQIQSIVGTYHVEHWVAKSNMFRGRNW